MSNDVEFLIIGGGAMGSATALSLAQRGHEVLLLERFEPGHLNGASHGTTRNFNPAYGRPEYLRLLQRSNTLWDEISAQAGTRLLHRTGLVNHGIVAEQRQMHEVLAGAGFASELLGIDEAEARFGGLKFETEVLHIPSGGQINADATLVALQELAAQAGADIRHSHRVTGIEVLDEGQAAVQVSSAAGEETLHARQVVLTAGAWTQQLLGTGSLPAIHVTEEHPVHFALRGEPGNFPGFNHILDGSRDIGSPVFGPVYGMHTPGQGIKAGWHGSGRVVDPEYRPHQVLAEQTRALQRYAEKWLPGVDPDDFEPVSCTYANTEDEHFILDKLGPITIGAGFSGHGFKFVPAIGEYLADLALGTRGAEALFAASGPARAPLFLERRRTLGLA
ncbi:MULTISPECIES: FAD-dependent oxidoreductase [Glutamicibacter]|uniref:FAD-dependent oxidoreductase n=1 Tax=Glutamicibacter halophytocola TaxID=1933880 RepID=A0AA95BQU8_9MICC|nr:FAD-dependent oxidoreductase [Glutamicibacter halophytocola]MBF6670617.1 FAD-dependent oxidoreductase [Glutamicibacter sp. FBE19]UUX58589.1 FAD-dependent oxidoreductase [Glutamicibacter halophytocola]